MYSLTDSTILVSRSKPSQNQFAMFDSNWFRFGKWNEKFHESQTGFGFGLSNGIRYALTCSNVYTGKFCFTI